MAGLVRPNRGEVLLENRPIQSYQKDFYQNVQMIFQDARSSFDPQKTIGQSFDEVQRHLCNVKVDNGEQLAKVDYLANVNIVIPINSLGDNVKEQRLRGHFW